MLAEQAHKEIVNTYNTNVQAKKYAEIYNRSLECYVK